MKKIALFLCFSIVGLVGFAQQSDSSTLNFTDLSNQENSLTIKIENIDFNDFKDKRLLESNDFNLVNLVNNTHELTHNSNESSNIEDKYFGDAFSYNEYVLSTDIKFIIDALLKY